MAGSNETTIHEMGAFAAARPRLLPLLVALAASPVHADALDDFVRAQMEKRHLPGAAIALVRDRAPVRFGAYGTADLTWEAPITADTVFAIGSLSKQFAAAAVMLLVQDGLLRLDARLDSVVSGMPSAWGAVTVRQLLTHTSGIASYTDLPDFETRNLLPVTREELVSSAARAPLLFPPGTDWSYGGTGYFVLGMIVEKVSGLSYAEFLERRIARPAGLVATRLAVPRDVVPRRAVEKGR